MKTKTMKVAEELAFERYSTLTILIHVYRRHELGFLYVILMLTYMFAAMHALGVF